MISDCNTRPKEDSFQIFTNLQNATTAKSHNKKIRNPLQLPIMGTSGGTWFWWSAHLWSTSNQRLETKKKEGQKQQQKQQWQQPGKPSLSCLCSKININVKFNLPHFPHINTCGRLEIHSYFPNGIPKSKPVRSLPFPKPWTHPKSLFTVISLP